MGFPNPYQYNTAQIQWSTDQASGSVNGGWLSGAAATQFTGTWQGSTGEFYSVYVMTSGANPPSSVRFADMTVRPIPIATLVLPNAAGTASVNYIGPTLSGANVANSIGFFNSVIPFQAGVLVDPGAGASWFKIVVVGR